MNKIKVFLMGFFKKFLADTVDNLMEEATLELHGEIDRKFTVEEAKLVKSMLPRLRSKVVLMIKNKI